MNEKYPYTFGPFGWKPLDQRKTSQPMGRFGGGWQFKLGVQTGSGSRQEGISGIVSLVTREYRFVYRPKSSRYRAQVGK